MTGEGWRIRRLGELLRVKHGYAFRGEFFGATGTHIVVTPGNFLEEGGFKAKGGVEKWYSGPVPTDFVLRKGDLIVAMTEQAEGLLGSGALIPEDECYLHNQRIGLVEPSDTSEVDLRFLYYLFNTRFVRRQIRATASGAKVRHTAPSRIEAVEAPVPEVGQQRRIADLLSDYDYLIDNNLRRIRLLEEMARAIYREWFVHFRFPGHEAVGMMKSALGPVPTGWHVVPASECLHISPRVVVPREDEKPFVPMGSLDNSSMVISDIEQRAGNSGSKFQNGDTLFARITPCLENGKTGFVQFLNDAQSVAFGSTEFIVLRGRQVTPEFTYLLARSDEFRATAIKSMTGATGRQRVQEQCFNAYSLAVPPQALLEEFSALVAPMFKLVKTLHETVVNLRTTRDLLLPRLMSGQLTLAESEASV